MYWCFVPHSKLHGKIRATYGSNHLLSLLIYVEYYKKNLSGHIFATKIVETFDNVNQKSIIMRADD